MDEDVEHEHEKDLLALEQEIEGWKSANRILNARLGMARNCLQEVFESEGLMYVKTVLDKLKD
jgi:hypothetical protein